MLEYLRLFILLGLLMQVTYGLSKRAKPSERQANMAGPIGEDPLNGLSVTSREWEAARFKQDVDSLPEVYIQARSPCMPCMVRLKCSEREFCCMAGAQLR